ncbi:hypothetical protein [Aeoliella mucimassa]|uniref:Uncharacterized protein n=1 Tax=Aeoliella mucimassa TaxID=2527972 RepID=A0A518AIW8_9BACT|nr:hypothetical protein [Aeoliella mucimassa]QDU54667.1 hypothetical protein Pan181_08500 [Aeoliella mucimassa]
MGYDLHITRKEHHFDKDGPAIRLDEWLAYVASDPEMRFDGFAEAQLPNGNVLRAEGEGLSVWTAYSGHELAGNMAWFDYWRGSIIVKNPDPEIIGKMVRIARALGAKVQGDESEIYAEDGSSNWKT